MELQLPRRSDNDNSPLQWSLLSKSYPGGLLLPNLRKFKSKDERLNDYYPLFFQPSLDALALSYDSADGVTSFVKKIGACSNSLRTLKLMETWDIEQDEIPPEIPASISRTIESLHSLTEIYVGRLLPQTLAQLTTLPYLRTLNFEAYPTDYRAAGPYHFSSVNYLAFSCTSDYSCIVPCLVEFSAPNLKILEISFHRLIDDWQDGVVYDLPTTACLAKLFDAIATTFPAVPELVLYTCRTSTSPAHTVTIDVLASLFALKHLERLDMLTCPLQLDPPDVARIARAWPRLRALVLGVGCPDTASLHVEDLLPLAEHCRALSQLALPLCIPRRSRAGCPAMRPAFDAFAAPLEYLFTDGPEIEFSPDVALWLAHTFPKASFAPWPDALSATIQAVMDMNDTKSLFVKVLQESMGTTVASKSLVNVPLL